MTSACGMGSISRERSATVLDIAGPTKRPWTRPHQHPTKRGGSPCVPTSDLHRSAPTRQSPRPRRYRRAARTRGCQRRPLSDRRVVAAQGGGAGPRRGDPRLPVRHVPTGARSWVGRAPWLPARSGATRRGGRHDDRVVEDVLSALLGDQFVQRNARPLPARTRMSVATRSPSQWPASSVEHHSRPVWRTPARIITGRGLREATGRVAP